MSVIAAIVKRSPAWLRRLAYRTAAGHGTLGVLADRVRYRFSESDLPILPAVGGKARRLVIGPANFAAQGYHWARAVERFVPETSAVSVRTFGQSAFNLEVDLDVPTPVYARSSTWQQRFEDYLSRQTHVIWEAGRPLLGRRYEGGIAEEIDRMQKVGVACALLFHGSDIRLPSAHAKSNPWSPFRESTDVVRNLEETAKRNAELAADAGVPLFVSTPDLLQWLPGAAWCPVVIDTEPWKFEGARNRRITGRVPMVAHAPSRPWLKGTDRIEPVLRRLADEGVIEYRQVLGIEHASMPRFYAEADVMLDQFAVGGYGVAACEAMASGCLVLGHVEESARREVREATGWELPVHETTIDSLETDLRQYARDPGAFDNLRLEGPRFVDEVHDGEFAASVLAKFLDNEV